MSLIPEDTIILDIGANIGIMTVHLGRSIKNCTVYSVEPIPANIVAFKRVVNYFKLNNIRLFETALGNFEGEAEMVLPIISSVRMQGLSHVIHNSITENNEGERFKVTLKKLDNMKELTNAPQRISAIKIDVENFEFFVLDGAKNLLIKNKPIVYAELWENENRNKCFHLFQQLNYTTFIVLNDKVVKFDSTKHKTQNFIFLPD